jgi:hypothetical protein
MIFTIFCFLVDEKIKPKVLACSLEITHKVLKNLPVTRFKDPKVAMLILRMLTGSRL